MSLWRTLVRTALAPLLPTLRERLRELVDEVMAEQPDPVGATELREVTTRVASASRQLAELRVELEACRAAVNTLAAGREEEDDSALRLAGLEARDEDLIAGLERTQERLSEASDRITELRRVVEAAAAKVASPEANVVGLRVTPLACQVPGCTRPHRARGFCAPHYQAWRRGTLEGFPNSEA